MRWLWPLGCVALLGFLCAAALAEDGFYRSDQAQGGLLLYNDNCAECHRPDLTGAMGPALKGDPFKARWGGRLVSDLFAYEHQTMPAVNPGSIPDRQLWPITAYILERNGLPAGDTPLSAKTADRPIPK